MLSLNLLSMPAWEIPTRLARKDIAIIVSLSFRLLRRRLHDSRRWSESVPTWPREGSREW